MNNHTLSRRDFLRGAMAGTAGLALSSIFGAIGVTEAHASAIVDPAIGNEIHVVSDKPYIMSGDQSLFVPDKVLSSGYTMPVIGIGTYALDVDTAENSVYNALKCGYHLVDTARAYWNEDGVGRGIKRAIEEGFITRDVLFVTTKVWDSDFADARGSVLGSLERLGLDYVDLVLLHHVPRSNDELGYHQMEELVREGKIRSLGLSNIYRDNDTFDRMFNAAEIKPVLVQNENHPFFHWDDFQEYAAANSVQIESWYPLGGRGFTQNYFNHPTLMAIAESYGKTVPQILLRWQVKKGFIAVPGSGNPEHIKENYDIFNFELSDTDMDTINAMNTGHGNFNMRA